MNDRFNVGSYSVKMLCILQTCIIYIALIHNRFYRCFSIQIWNNVLTSSLVY